MRDSYITLWKFKISDVRESNEWVIAVVDKFKLYIIIKLLYSPSCTYKIEIRSVNSITERLPD